MDRIEEAILKMDERVNWLDEKLDLGFTDKWMSELLSEKDEINEIRSDFIVLKNIRDALMLKGKKLSNVLDLFYKLEAYDDLDIENCYIRYEEEQAMKGAE